MKLITDFTAITNPVKERLLTLGDQVTGERFRISIDDFFNGVNTDVFINASDTSALLLDRLNSSGVIFNTRQMGASIFQIVSTNADGSLSETILRVPGAAGGVMKLQTNGSNDAITIGANQKVTIHDLGTGTVYSNGGELTNVNPSDERLKTVYGEVPYGLKEVLKLEPVLFNYHSDEEGHTPRLGYIANKVKDIIPELVEEFDHKDENGDLVKRYGFTDQTPNQILVNAIKELTARVEALEAK